MTDDTALLRQALQALESYSRWAASMDTELRAANAILAIKQRLEPLQMTGQPKNAP